MADTKQLVELIEKLAKDAGGKPMVVNFADGNHATEYTAETLADPAVLAVLKKSGFNTIVVEGTHADGMRGAYDSIRKKVAENKSYSIDDLANDIKSSPEELDSKIKLLINAAKQSMELVFPDNAMVAGSKGQLSENSMDIAVFLKEQSVKISKGRKECAGVVWDELINRIPEEKRVNFIDELRTKRLGDNAPSNEPVIEAINKATKSGKNVAVVYGAEHFKAFKDINDGEIAKHKPVIYIATNDDMRRKYWDSMQQFPEYRYDPEIGEASKFNLEQISAAHNAKRDPAKMSDDKCKQLVPLDFKFENYKPESVEPVKPQIPTYVPTPQRSEPPASLIVP